MENESYDLVIIGGGAAGIFAAINTDSKLKVLVIEKNREPLQKVKVSGGGRCNVTNSCYEPAELIKNYPRGAAFLLPLFQKFGPKEMVDWFSQRNVKIKKEADGRMFPITDSSQTIIDCFLTELQKRNIPLLTSTKLIHFEKNGNHWKLELDPQKTIYSKNILIATGSDKHIWEMLKGLKINIIEPVPSLFTFKFVQTKITELTGLSFAEIEASYGETKIKAPGLITHWGMSGPAILKLSAFGARALHAKNYVFDLYLDWLPKISKEEIQKELRNFQATQAKKKVRTTVLFDLPKRFWEFLCEECSVGEFQNWSETGKKHFQALEQNLKKMKQPVNGKSTFKEEFVTAGGVDLEEIDPNTFMVKSQEGLYLAGEVMNIDAITGGFNFQAAWTTSYLIAKSLSAK